MDILKDLNILTDSDDDKASRDNRDYAHLANKYKTKYLELKARQKGGQSIQPIQQGGKKNTNNTSLDNFLTDMETDYNDNNRQTGGSANTHDNTLDNFLGELAGSYR